MKAKKYEIKHTICCPMAAGPAAPLCTCRRKMQRKISFPIWQNIRRIRVRGKRKIAGSLAISHFSVAQGARGNEDIESVGFIEQDSTTGQNSLLCSFCPVGILLGSAFPKTCLLFLYLTQAKSPGITIIPRSPERKRPCRSGQCPSRIYARGGRLLTFYPHPRRRRRSNVRHR